MEIEELIIIVAVSLIWYGLICYSNITMQNKHANIYRNSLESGKSIHHKNIEKSDDIYNELIQKYGFKHTGISEVCNKKVGNLVIVYNGNYHNGIICQSLIQVNDNTKIFEVGDAILHKYVNSIDDVKKALLTIDITL